MSKKLTVKEARSLGIISEINRLILHPRGLAICVNIEEDESEHIFELLDCRDDEEGILYSDLIFPSIKKKKEIFDSLKIFHKPQEL